MASQDLDRTAPFGRQLAQAHQELRRQIKLLREHAGQRQSTNVFTTHCLAFCTALKSHHNGEDRGMFGDLLRVRPDLAATISNLIEDHEMIASILARVTELADHAAGSDGPVSEAISRELDGLTAIMESHFVYEERAVGAALDRGIPDTGWSDRVFMLRQ